MLKTSADVQHGTLSNSPCILVAYFLQVDDEEVALIRQKLIEVRQSWHKRNEEEVMKRWAFEEAV